MTYVKKKGSTDDLRKPAQEIDCRGTVPVSVAFSADGRQVVSGECSSNLAKGRLRWWQVKDGKEVPGTAVDASSGVYGVAVSSDGQWRVSIEGRGAVVRTAANKRIATVGDHRDAASRVYVIDVSPDGTRFASGSGDGTVRVFSNTGQRLLGPLRHDNKVYGVKFSPGGDRLASAALADGLAHLTPGSVRIWDTSTGAKLVDVSINKIFTPCTPFAWVTNDQLFVVASSQISQIHVQTGQVRSGWSLPASYDVSYCSLVTNGRFIVCSDDARVTFWDATSLTRVGPTLAFQSVVRTIALSPDGHCLACGRNDEKIVLYALRELLPLYYILDPVLQLPLIKVDGDVFKSWIEDDLISAEAILSKEVVPRSSSKHHVLANRALVRARRQQWSGALEAAEESLAIQPSPLPHVAKAIARIGQGEQERALESFDLVFRDCSTDDIEFLLLIKGILLYVAGKRDEGVSRVNSLLSGADDGKKYDYFQVLGNMHLKLGDFERAMTSFGQAQSYALARQGFRLVTILLMFGASFEELEITVRRPLREATTA